MYNVLAHAHTLTEEVSGIYITSLNPHGPAAKDGRVRVGDRIMKVDGHSLRGLENMEAASVLRNSGDPVKLVLSRKRRKRSVSPHELGGMFIVKIVIGLCIYQMTGSSLVCSSRSSKILYRMKLVNISFFFGSFS